MIINPQNLRAFQLTLDTEFSKAMKDAVPDGLGKALFFDKVAIGRKTVKYPWVSANARVVKVPKGTPSEKQRLPLNILTVDAGKANCVLEIDEFDLECDQEGLYVDQLREAGSQVSDFDERYAAELLTAGFTTAYEDGGGQNFFDDACLVSPDLGSSSQTFDNQIVNVLGATGYDLARQRLMNMTDGKGRPRGLGARGFILICGPANDAAARDLLLTERTTGGMSNKYYNSADLIVSPYLGTSTTWYLVAKTGSSAGKPLIRQTNSKWRSRMSGTSDTNAIVNGTILYENVWYGEHAYGDRQLVIGSTGAG